MRLGNFRLWLSRVATLRHKYLCNKADSDVFHSWPMAPDCGLLWQFEPVVQVGLHDIIAGSTGLNVSRSAGLLMAIILRLPRAPQAAYEGRFSPENRLNAAVRGFTIMVKLLPILVNMLQPHLWQRFTSNKTRYRT